MSLLDSVRFNSHGLLPAIVQDAVSGQVLMLAYMNRESLEITLQEGYTCFYSRSRKELWRKGETSGNKQKVTSLSLDCDSDSLLVQVEPAGPACHTGATSCFYQSLAGEQNDFSLEQLYRLLVQRQLNPPAESYTSYLFREGLDKILKKVGEESTEVIIAAKSEDNPELVYEIADLAYHLLVLMVERGVTVSEIQQELASRHIVDNKEKQQYMK